MRKKKRFSTGNDELDAALKAERILTARWYERMSGQVGWGPGERDRLLPIMEASTVKANQLVSEAAAREFSELPFD